MSIYKKNIRILSILVLFLIMSVSLKVHAETVPQVLDMGNKTVSSNKEWTIKFNLPIKFDASDKQYVSIKDSNGSVVPTNEYLSTDKKSLIITPPDGGYTYGQNYELDIKDGLISENNSSLMQPVKISFFIGGEIKTINGVEDTVKLCSGSSYRITPLAIDESGNTVTNAMFSYTSSNPSVANVGSDGTITAVSEGSSIITIACGNITKQIVVNISNELSIKDIAKNSNAVVYVEVSNENKQPIASGSGFIIKDDGTIVTNYHVVDGASYAKVTLEDGRRFDVDKVLSVSKEHDIVLLKLKNASSLPIVSLGDSDKLSPGDEVVAIGSPGGIQFQNTVTDGIISGFRTTGRLCTGEKDIQISASIYHGSSGGALFNSLGQVIGVTYAGSEDVPNVNFAIPINEITSFLSDDINKTLLELASTPPSAPTGIKSSLRNSTVIVSWNANIESDVAGYYLYESSNSDSDFSRVYFSDGWFGRTNLINATAVQISGYTGETYYFYVTAVNTKGIESKKSTTISVKFN